MKYMIEYEIRTTGLSHDQNLANQAALLNAFGKWKPEEGLTVHAFVANLNNGGYVLVEAADPGPVASFVSRATRWNSAGPAACRAPDHHRRVWAAHRVCQLRPSILLQRVGCGPGD